jgi:hypothetical protein
MMREASGPTLRELLDPQIDFALRLLLGVAVTRLKKAEQCAAFTVTLSLNSFQFSSISSQFMNHF